MAAESANTADAEVDGDQKYLFVVAGRSTRRIALSVDELVGQQMVLIRPLQGCLSSIRGVTGCALLGSGGVGMVLDMGYVFGHA
jgi:two-component system chemotaxis sensor kinase CheA